MPEAERKDETRVGMLEARDGFTEYADRAWDGERVVVTRYDRERIVILGWRDYERLRALEQSEAA